MPAGDRVQIIGTDKQRGLLNGNAGPISKIEDTTIHLQLDGRGGRQIAFDAKEFNEFRHGYAGTIYKGQGRTLDQTYLYHSEHWRSAASYVSLTRHRDKAEVFVARNTAPNLKQLAYQMARVDNRKAASHYFQSGEDNSGEAVSQGAVRTGLGRDMQEEQPRAVRKEPEPGSLAADLAAAERRAAMDELSARQGRDNTSDERARTKEDGATKRSRDRGGGRSL
jgi:hypothetical protein